MFERRIPEWLRHAPAPSVRGFATLAGVEAVTRGVLISVFPVAMYNALQDAALVSSIYFAIGVASLAVGLLVPYINKFVPRRLLYGLGVVFYIIGNCIAVLGTPVTIITSLVLNFFATVIVYVCLNAYVLDYISRIELGKSETLRLFYSALGWAIGPALGVFLARWWPPAPFLFSAGAATFLLGVFAYMRLGNGKHIVRAKAPAANPLAYVGRFIAQPRLILGWTFAVIRSCGWWAYVVYLPIFAVKSGLGEQLGGIFLSLTNAVLFLSPLMLRWVQSHSIRYAVRTGFLVSGALFFTAGVFGSTPWTAISFLFVGSFFLILLDICGGLPFLMAVKPSERTEMSAIYSSFRDVSGIVTPGVAWVVLLFAPISGIFVAAGGACFVAWWMAGWLHPRLGERRASSSISDQRELEAEPV